MNKLLPSRNWKNEEFKDYLSGKILWECRVCGKEYKYGKYFTPLLFSYRQCDSMRFCSSWCVIKYILFYKKEHLDKEHYGSQTTIRRGLKNWFRHKILKIPLYQCRNE